jgi:hypothetical protein
MFLSMERNRIQKSYGNGVDRKERIEEVKI